MGDEGPPRSGRDGVLWRAVRRLAMLADSSVRLDAPAANAFLGGKVNAHLCANAYNDGSAFQRYDTTQPAAIVLVVPGGTLQLLTVGAGANPIAGWTGSATLGADSGWLAAAGLYAANWSDFDAGHAVQYRKDATGRVWLRGLAKKAVALALPDTILTLPAGFRPTRADNPVSVASNAGGYTELRVNTAGAVFIWVGGSAVWTGADMFGFDTA
jgi:hypothetical protein